MSFRRIDLFSFFLGAFSAYVAFSAVELFVHTTSHVQHQTPASLLATLPPPRITPPPSFSAAGGCAALQRHIRATNGTVCAPALANDEEAAALFRALPLDAADGLADDAAMRELCGALQHPLRAPAFGALRRLNDLAQIVIGVMTGARLYAREVYAMQDAWFSAHPLNARFVFVEAADARALIDNRTVVVLDGVGETRNSSHLKQFLGLAHMHRARPNAAWFLFIGSDTFVHTRHLAAALDALDPDERHYLGLLHRTRLPPALRTPERDSIEYVNGGAGVLLSRGTMRVLAPLIAAFVGADSAWPRDAWHECDVALGYLLAALGIRPRRLPGMYSMWPAWYHELATTHARLERRPLQRAEGDEPLAFHYLTSASRISQLAEYYAHEYIDRLTLGNDACTLAIEAHTHARARFRLLSRLHAAFFPRAPGGHKK